MTTGNRAELAGLVNVYTKIQRERIAFSLRRQQMERDGNGSLESPGYKLAIDYESRFLYFEQTILGDIERYATELPIVDQLIKIKGIGKLLAAKIAAPIDITIADTVSSLWKYAGYAVNDQGKSDRPTKGERLHYNPSLKSTLYVVASSMLRANSPYRRVYDRSKEQYQGKTDWTKQHIHFASNRKMIKMFLSHLWLVWRQMEGLPVTQPYVHDVMQHTHYETPAEYGWEISP